MRSFFKGAIVASLVGLALAACGNDGGGVDAGPDFAGYCSAFVSCETCTPANGCGWCYDSNGTGTCAASPDECPTLSFSWTWDPSGCRVTADASVVPAPRPAEAGAATPIEASVSIAVDASTEAAITDGALPPLLP
jgi:hypothetical protein